MGQVHLRTNFLHERIAVDAGEINKHEVQIVDHAAFRSLLVLVLQILNGGAGVALRFSRAFALRTHAEGLLQLRQFGFFLFLMRFLRFRIDQFQQRGDRLEALGAVEDLFCQVDGHRAAFCTAGSLTRRRARPT